MPWKHPRHSPTIHIWCRIYPSLGMRSAPSRSLLVFLSVCVSLTQSLWSFTTITAGNFITVQPHRSNKLHQAKDTSKAFLDLVTLTFELDLDIRPLDLHTKNQVCMSVRSVVRVVTHTQTDTQTMSILLHPSLTRGVKKLKLPHLDSTAHIGFRKHLT